VCPRPVRVERPPYPLIVEPADPLSTPRPACVFGPSRPLRPLSISAVPGTSSVFGPVNPR
jgi:hypothetical protein